MDIHSGRLVADIDQVPASLRGLFTPVPGHLQDEARRRLGGRPEVIVSRKEQGRLAEWAEKKRAKNRKRNKLAKASRKRSRK